MIVEQLKEILVERRTSDGMIFKRLFKKIFKVQKGGVNEAIKYLKSKSITETNNLNGYD